METKREEEKLPSIDKIMETFNEQYCKWYKTMNESQGRATPFCESQKELAKDIKELSQDMQKLSVKLHQTQQEGKIQAEAVEKTRVEVMRMNKEFLGQELVAKMLASSDTLDDDEFDENLEDELNLDEDGEAVNIDENIAVNIDELE